MARPKARNSEGEKELDKVQEQFEQFEQEIKDLTVDKLASAPTRETESQTKMSQNEILNCSKIYLKPKTTLFSKEKFNEKFREEYNFAKEYVQFIAENIEIPKESTQFWTKPFPGCPAEEWVVPVNKPVWGPRYVAERIDGCKYSKLTMNENDGATNDVKTVQFCGKMVCEESVPRIKAVSVSSKRSVFT